MAIDVTPGGPDANAYATVQDAKDFADARGLTYGADAEIESGLIVTAAWMDGYYLHRFPGRRASATQARAWPREDAEDWDGYAIEGVPKAVVHANILAALFEGSNPGELQNSFSLSGAIKSEQVGPLKTSYRDVMDVSDMRTVLASVEDTLAPVLFSRRAEFRSLTV